MENNSINLFLVKNWYNDSFFVNKYGFYFCLGLNKFIYNRCNLLVWKMGDKYLIYYLGNKYSIYINWYLCKWWRYILKVDFCYFFFFMYGYLFVIDGSWI